MIEKICLLRMVSKGMSNDPNHVPFYLSGQNQGEGRRATSRTACVTKVGGGEPLVGGQTMNRRVGGWLTLAGAEGSKARASGGGMNVGDGRRERGVRSRGTLGSWISSEGSSSRRA